MRKYIYYEEILDSKTRENISQNYGYEESVLDPKAFIKELKNIYSEADTEEPEYLHILKSVELVVETKEVYLDPYFKKLKEIDKELALMINNNNFSLIYLKHLRSELYSISKYQLCSEGQKLKEELLENIRLCVKFINKEFK